MLAFYIDLQGPLHWLSKRQSVTAGSSAEAKIYATVECVKFLLELSQILKLKINITDIFTKEMKDVNHFVTLQDLFMCHCLVS
jgi:hypothetical protein